MKPTFSAPTCSCMAGTRELAPLIMAACPALNTS
jgi:hypothetical protein